MATKKSGPSGSASATITEPATAAKPRDPAEINPKAFYAIKLSRAVKHGMTWLRPCDHRLRVTGATLADLGDAVLSYDEVK